MGLFKIFKKKEKTDYSKQKKKELEENKKTETKDEWSGRNIVERTREDGYVIYKPQYVTSVEEEHLGFLGVKTFSNNSKYCIVNGQTSIALVDCITKGTLFQKSLKRPKKCKVSNNGIVVCNDWLGYGPKPAGKFYAFDVLGSEIFSTKIQENLGDVLDINDEGSMAVFVRMGSYKLVVVDLNNRKILHSYQLIGHPEINFKDKTVTIDGVKKGLE